MSDTCHINYAAGLLALGKTVAFPTETVYGLGADATNTHAIDKIFKIKRRPPSHPLIVHIAQLEELKYWACDINPIAWKLAASFWPGPLTLIMQRAPYVSDIITGGQDSIALRMPAHPTALKLLNALGNGVVAPSANRFKRISPTCAAHVLDELGNEVDFILDGGACNIGIESTILDIRAKPNIIRLGPISASSIQSCLSCEVSLINDKTVRAPGTHKKHYAPQTRVYLVDSAQIDQLLNTYLSRDQRVAVISTSRRTEGNSQNVMSYLMPQSPDLYSQQLYKVLRAADNEHCAAIIIEKVPIMESWSAICDRLNRASCR